MYSIRRWLYKPKKNDPSLLAQLFYADEELNLVATELDSFDGRKDPERCTTLVNQLRMCQDHVLNIIHQIMDTVILSERANRDFRVKFPDDVLQENLAGQLWFGAECLAAGSSVMNREVESASMRPLAKAVTKTLDNLRSLLRDQALRDPLNYTEKIREALKQFDQLFSEFELSYVSAMVPVKTMKEYDIQQDVIVLFSEAVQRALRLKLLTQEMIDDYDPALMFTIPRLAIVCGLLIHPEGPLNVDMDPSDISEMFRPFQSLLYKIRDLLWTLNKSELYTLEKVLCSTEDPGIFLNLKKVNFPDDYRPPDRQEFIERFYKDHPGCEQFIKSLHYLHCHRPDLGIRCGSYQSEAQLGNSTSEENIQGTLPDSDSQEDFLAEQTFVAMQENLSLTLENVIDSGDQTQDSGVGSDCSISDKSHEHSSAVSHVYVDLKAIQNDIVIIDNLTLAVENMKYSNCENQALQIPVIEIDSDRNCSSEPDSPNSVICCVGETQPEPSKITLIHNILEQCSDSSENTHANSSTDQTSLISSNYTINTSEAINANSSTDQTLISSAYNINPGKLKADNIQISSSHVIEKSINFPNSCDKNSISVETSALKPIRHKSHLCSRHKAKHADSLNHDSLGLREEYTKLRQTEGESQALEIPRLHQLRYSGSISGSSCSSHRSSLCNSDWEPEGYDSSDTSSYNSECHDDEEIALAIQAAEIATRNEVRSRFHNSADLIHRLFVCISGVADQLQTNYASDLRNILKSVFEINCSEPMTNFLDDIQYIQTAEEVHSDSEDHIGSRRSFEEPPPWIPDEQAPHCSTCKIPFTIVRRRHHCRNCGKIFCSRCSINSVPLPRYGHVKPVRVCNCCFMFQVTPFMVDE